MPKLFAPKSISSDLCIDYPELKDYKEFNRLNPKQVKFAYFIGNRTSPHIKLDPQKRYRVALRDSGLDEDLTESQLDNYKSGIFDDIITEAIEKMASFRVSERLRIVFINESIFNSGIELILTLQAELESTGDNKKRGEIMDVIFKTREAVSNLILPLETRWGVIEEENESNGKKFMDEILA